MLNKTFKPADIAVESGVYRVVHAQHRLPHEVVVLRGDRFPRCAKCTGAVSFELFYAAPFVVSTYKNALPVLDYDAPDVLAAD
jgi:uncharacterized membrane protein